MTPERLREIRVSMNVGGIIDELLDYIDELQRLNDSTPLGENIPCESCNWAPDEYWEGT